MVWKYTGNFDIIGRNEKKDTGEIKVKKNPHCETGENKQMKESPNEETNETMSEEEIKKLARVQFLILAFLFFAVIVVTGIVSVLLGKTAGTIALILIAASIVLYLYKEDIKQRFQKKQ